MADVSLGQTKRSLGSSVLDCWCGDQRKHPWSLAWGSRGNAFPLAQRSTESWCETLGSPVYATQKLTKPQYCAVTSYCVLHAAIMHIGHCYYVIQLLKQVTQYNSVINGEAWQYSSVKYRETKITPITFL